MNYQQAGNICKVKIFRSVENFFFFSQQHLSADTPLSLEQRIFSTLVDFISSPLITSDWSYTSLDLSPAPYTQAETPRSDNFSSLMMAIISTPLLRFHSIHYNLIRRGRSKSSPPTFRQINLSRDTLRNEFTVKCIGEFPEKNPPTLLAYPKIICPLPRSALR